MENLEKNNIQKKIGAVTVSFLIFLLFIALGVSVFYNVKLQEQLDNRDIIIEGLTQKDSIFSQIMELQYDSISKSTFYEYRLKNGKIMKYNELIKEIDESSENYLQILKDQNKIINESTHNVENYNTLIRDLNIQFNNYKDLQKKYNDLVGIYNYSKMNYNYLLDSLNNYKHIVEIVHSKYFIDYEIIKEAKYNIITIKSDKLDSALVLLPFFRDRLEKDKNIWKIKTK